MDSLKGADTYISITHIDTHTATNTHSHARTERGGQREGEREREREVHSHFYDILDMIHNKIHLIRLLSQAVPSPV